MLNLILLSWLSRGGAMESKEKNAQICGHMGCRSPVPPRDRHCPACGNDVGVPNVRKSRDTSEVVALGLRHAKARESAVNGNFDSIFDAYEAAVRESQAVVCMFPSRLLQVVLEGALLSTFMKQVEGEMRVAQDNEFDAVRSSFEEAYFPGYSSSIRFGALSLDGFGHAAYGTCAVSLKDQAIESRASVFEFPLFKFSQNLNLAKPIPVGHRADWSNRAKLAAAKAIDSLAQERPPEFREILLPTPTDTTSDCIEVHIYGALNIHSIKGVSFYAATRPADSTLQQVISDSLKDQGIPMRDAK